MKVVKKTDFKDAIVVIKEAIIRSRYQAAALVNKELLCLYYAVGKFVSENSGSSLWGKSAIRHLSDNLQKELPGLRGFSESAIKRMRSFYEEWSAVLLNRPLTTDDLYQRNLNRPMASGDLNYIETNRPLTTGDLNRVDANRALTTHDLNTIADLKLLERHIVDTNATESFATDFLRVGFYHHSEILANEKSLEGRMFYISQCAEGFWSVEALKSKLRGKTFSKTGTMPNNFVKTLPVPEQARRAMRSFKDEYLLDFINIEDDDDPDERVLERGIANNIKKFILSFGNKFCFVGNQYRVVVDGEENFIDLLFFNRELRSLVAVELKRGKFKPSYLGQMTFYLSALDKTVRQKDESPSIGIILCKEANKNIVEFAVRDYSKPLGVATYKTRKEMPAKWRKALPDLEDMRKLLAENN